MSRKSKQQAILKKLTESRMSERVEALRASFFAAKKKAETLLPPNALLPIITKFNAVVPSPNSKTQTLLDSILPYSPHREFAESIMQAHRTTEMHLDLFDPEKQLKKELFVAVKEEIAEIDAGLDLIKKAHDSEDIKEMIEALTACQDACQELEAALTLE